MNETIDNIVREKGFDYKVDRKGNIIKYKYSYFKDPYTYITFIIILMGFLYWSEVKTARSFVDSDCVQKCMIDDYIDQFNLENPGMQLICDYDTKTCQYSGILEEQKLHELDSRGFNFTAK